MVATGLFALRETAEDNSSICGCAAMQLCGASGVRGEGGDRVVIYAVALKCGYVRGSGITKELQCGCAGSFLVTEDDRE